VQESDGCVGDGDYLWVRGGSSESERLVIIDRLAGRSRRKSVVHR
jgi:hypothetical protein